MQACLTRGEGRSGGRGGRGGLHNLRSTCSLWHNWGHCIQHGLGFCKGKEGEGKGGPHTFHVTESFPSGTVESIGTHASSNVSFSLTKRCMRCEYSSTVKLSFCTAFSSSCAVQAWLATSSWVTYTCTRVGKYRVARDWIGGGDERCAGRYGDGTTRRSM